MLEKSYLKEFQSRNKFTGILKNLKNIYTIN